MPYQDMRPMWCSPDKKSSYSLGNLTKILFSEKQCLPSFCQTEYRVRKILFYLGFFFSPGKSIQIKIVCLYFPIIRL